MRDKAKEGEVKKLSLPCLPATFSFILFYDPQKSSFKNEAQIIIKKLLIQPKILVTAADACCSYLLLLLWR